MADKMYVVGADGELKAMQEHPYDNEAALQTLIEKYPNLLAGEQMDERNPRRWLLIKREMGVASDEGAGNRWSLDHLFVDQDGILTLVEVKRGADTRARRNVVGQLLDYAANAVVYWPIEQIRQRFVDTCNEQKIDADGELLTFLDGESDEGGDASDLDDEQRVESFWQLVRNQMKIGRIRLVFLADQIPSELLRIVEFLDEHMADIDVFAIEIKQFKGEGIVTLVPTLVGRSAKVDQKKQRALATPKEMRPGFEAVLRAYDNQTSAAILETGKGNHKYRQIHQESWSAPLHYEFLDCGKKGIGVEFHIEQEGHERLAAELETMMGRLKPHFPGAKHIEWKRKWFNGGRLRVVYRNDVPPADIAESMTRLINLTKPTIFNALIKTESAMA